MLSSVSNDVCNHFTVVSVVYWFCLCHPTVSAKAVRPSIRSFIRTDIVTMIPHEWLSNHDEMKLTYGLIRFWRSRSQSAVEMDARVSKSII